MDDQSLRPGGQIQSSRRIARYQPIRFAAALSDFNPLHIDRELAVMMGLPDLPLQPEGLVPLIEQLIEQRIQPDDALAAVDVRFAAHAVQGQLLDFELMGDRLDGNVLVCRFTVKDQATEGLIAEGEVFIRNAVTGSQQQ